ncbi:MAG: hypothetical protein NUV81_03490 [bacterium]|nr:hypothetical protein [bacterium]
MEKKWFRAKNFGYGWQPATWQGWLILFGFIGFMMWDFQKLDLNSHSASDTLRPFVIHLILAIILLLGICYRFGEKPEWRWNGKPIKRIKDDSDTVGFN